MIVDFEPGFLVYLTVENIGKTMARDVRIKFDKPLDSTLQGRREIDDSPLFREPIPALPPGKKIRVLFDTYEERVASELPLAYEVRIKYRGTSRNAKFDDLYKLDLGMYLGSALPSKGIPELVGEVEKITEEIKRWRGSSLEGLLVRTNDTRHAERASQRRMRIRILQERGPGLLARYLWNRTLQRFGLR